MWVMNLCAVLAFEAAGLFRQPPPRSVPVHAAAAAPCGLMILAFLSTTMGDPQRGGKRMKPTFKTIGLMYRSVVAKGLFATLAYDDLPADFVMEHMHPNFAFHQFNMSAYGETTLPRRAVMGAPNDLRYLVFVELIRANPE